MSRELSDGRPGGGQEDRLLVYFLPYFIHLIFISSHASPPSFHCLSSFSPTNSAAADSSSALSSAACVRDHEDSNHGVQGTAGGSRNFLLGSAGGRIEEARAADSSSALSSAACVRDSEVDQLRGRHKSALRDTQARHAHHYNKQKQTMNNEMN